MRRSTSAWSASCARRRMPPTCRSSRAPSRPCTTCCYGCDCTDSTAALGAGQFEMPLTAWQPGPAQFQVGRHCCGTGPGAFFFCGSGPREVPPRAWADVVSITQVWEGQESPLNTVLPKRAERAAMITPAALSLYLGLEGSRHSFLGGVVTRTHARQLLRGAGTLSGRGRGGRPDPRFFSTSVREPPVGTLLRRMSCLPPSRPP